MTKTLIALMAALTIAGGAAYAADVEDTDGNGVYSFDELKAAYPSLTDEQFADVDADADGSVTGEELLAAIEGEVL